MHKGRHYPQTKRRWLTPNAIGVSFAPVRTDLDAGVSANPAWPIRYVGRSYEVIHHYPVMMLEWVVDTDYAGRTYKAHLFQRIPPSGRNKEWGMQLEGPSGTLYTEWLNGEEDLAGWRDFNLVFLDLHDQNGVFVPSEGLFAQYNAVPYW